jgi:hypothetical protein
MRKNAHASAEWWNCVGEGVWEETSQAILPLDKHPYVHRSLIYCWLCTYVFVCLFNRSRRGFCVSWGIQYISFHKYVDTFFYCTGCPTGPLRFECLGVIIKHKVILLKADCLFLKCTPYVSQHIVLPWHVSNCLINNERFWRLISRWFWQKCITKSGNMPDTIQNDLKHFIKI